MRDLDTYTLDPESKIFLPNSMAESKAFTTRSSTFSIYGEPHGTYWGVEANTERAVLSEKKIKSLENKIARDAIRTLLKSFPIFKEALALYRQNINQGKEFQCDDERAREVVIRTYEEMDRDLNDIIDEQVFAMLVGGGSSYEIVRRTSDNTIADLAYVDPDTLDFQEPDPNPDQVYKIYQKSPKSVDDILLHDPTDESMLNERQTFFYKALHKMGDNPRGISVFISALSAAIGKLNLDSLLPKITKNQGFPRGFLSPKIAELVDAGLTGTRLTDYLKDAVTKLKNELDTASPTESVISSVGMEFIILGLLGRQNIDGATLVNENFLYDLQVALDLPDQLLPARKTAVLGEQSGRTQWTRWQNVLRYYRDFFSASLNPTTQIILSEAGFGFNQIKCPIVFDNTDRELEKYEAEAFNEKVDGITKAIQAGILNREQGFNLLTNKVEIGELEYSPEATDPTPENDEVDSEE